MLGEPAPFWELHQLRIGLASVDGVDPEIINTWRNDIRALGFPSRRQIADTGSSPRIPSITIRIFSSAENCRRLPFNHPFRSFPGPSFLPQGAENPHPHSLSP